MTTLHQMKIISASDYLDVSRQAAKIILDVVHQNPEAAVGLATGSSPLGMYQELIADHRANGTSYSRVQTYNLDEYVGLDVDHPQSYARFMREHLFDSIDIKLENTHIPNGKAPNLEAECRRYEQMVADTAGMDVLVLGIGANGHIGFNEPGVDFSVPVHVATLTESTRKGNARFFEREEEVPTHAITMGISTILQAKKIVLIASGERKAHAVHALCEGPVTQQIPATALHTHADVTIVADVEAASLLTK